MRIPKIHELKVWMNFYPDLETQEKTFELRKNDRDFQKGDFLNLKPFDSIKKQELKIGRQLAKVTYVLKDSPEFGLKDGYAILGLKFWSEFTQEERLLFRLIESGKIHSEMEW